MRRALFTLAFLSLSACAQDVDIPFQKFVLGNGLALPAAGAASGWLEAAAGGAHPHGDLPGDLSRFGFMLLIVAVSVSDFGRWMAEWSIWGARAILGALQ